MTLCRPVYALGVVLGIFLTVESQVQDNRCYLENGASSESFFVSEDAPIGSLIGQIRIHGDPRPGGTVQLHLQELDSPVDIVTGSKNLTLRRRLDKEGKNGPSSVFVNLICDRVHTIDPGFVIPVNIRVTDANDNAPKFVNAPYVLNISEVTVIGTRVLQGVHAIDEDQQGPFSSIRYSVLPGKYSHYFQFENELDGTLVLKKALDYENLRRFDVGIRAQDHGEPPKYTDTILTVYVVDADDQNPKFLDDRYHAILPASSLDKNRQVVLRPRDIKAFDQDLGINSPVYYSFNGKGPDYSYFTIDKVTGAIFLIRNLNEVDLQHPTTLVVKATQSDNSDRYALATVTISRNSNAPIKFLKHVFHVSAKENLPPGSTLAILNNNRPGQSLRYFVSDKEILTLFTITPKGELGSRASLDFEKRSDYVFKVFATDGISNDSCVVNITVVDVNEWEPRFRYPHYEFYVADPNQDIVGRVQVKDGDKNDQVTLLLSGGNTTDFTIAQNGEIKLKRKSARVGVANFQVVATDENDPPHTSSVPVTVHFSPPKEESLFPAAAGQPQKGNSLILAGLGGALLLLAIIITILVLYILRAKGKVNRQQLPTLGDDKHRDSENIEKSTPMFRNMLKSPTAKAMGGVPSSKSKPSPKIYPAPQPPQWPQANNGRVKKLSWTEEKTDSDSVENADTVHKLTENTNLTVYF